MSSQAVQWALERATTRDEDGRDVPIPARVVAVLVGLASHADPDGRGAFPTVSQLAAYARKSERAVQADLQWLAREGLIRRRPGVGLELAIDLDVAAP